MSWGYNENKKKTTNNSNNSTKANPEQKLKNEVPQKQLQKLFS